MADRVLCVDDDPGILSAFRRTLRKELDLVTAESGEQALKLLPRQGPFAVVLSDQRMPGMGGVKLLAELRRQAPDTVRMMLTGNADQQTAIDAINEGSIFRFLTKPCQPDLLLRALRAGIEQHRLITAERELLERTLKGCIKVLVEILSLTNPEAFSRAARIRAHVSKVAACLHLDDPWQYEVAALLSQIGFVTLPSDILVKLKARQRLSPTEAKMLEEHPSVGRGLLAGIPRLEQVAEMVGGQQFSARMWTDHDAGDPVSLGARLLRLCTDYDVMMLRGMPPERALALMGQNPEIYSPEMVQALAAIITPATPERAQTIPVGKLENGMRLASHVRTTDGILLVSQGHEVTEVIRRCLLNYSQEGRIGGMIRVIVPREGVSAS